VTKEVIEQRHNWSFADASTIDLDDDFSCDEGIIVSPTTIGNGLIKKINFTSVLKPPPEPNFNKIY
jgi:hypothetical protein